MELKTPKFLRHRTVLVWLAPLLVLGVLFFTDPDRGASTGIWLVKVATAIVAVALSHWSMKALFDYREADRRTLLREALGGNAAAAIALLAQAITFVGLLMLFAGQVRAQDVRTYVSPQAHQYLPTLAAERLRWWPDHPRPAMLAALIEHESGCFALKRKCWNPKSQLKSAREEGAGLAQITRAYRGDGSVRFDALQELVDQHPALAGWSWENVYDRVDMQIRAVVLKQRGDFRTLKGVDDIAERLVFTDVAYNRGIGGLQAERRACGLKADCNPKLWFGHVEHVCLASRAALYGGRSACDISRHHPVDVLKRTPKYEALV
ncbi:MAG TPA: hypothetical protein VD932_06720 [Aquabacterium sp.]|nr:hypothetical protein [Aquabacterium sp.]